MSTSNNCKCIRCNIDMHEGEIFIEIDMFARGSGFNMNPLTGMRLPISEQISSSNLSWKENTGIKKGWLLKKDEKKTYNVSGRRCPNCGFIELFVKE